MLRKPVRPLSHSSVWGIQCLIEKFVVFVKIKSLYNLFHHYHSQLCTVYPLIKVILVHLEQIVMSQDLISQQKWTCEYCTYENFPNALKCTMCRGAKPISFGEDIFRIHKNEPSPTNAAGPCINENSLKWSCDVCTFLNLPKNKDCCECRSPRYPVTADNIHEQFRPLRITESESKPAKWSCSVCTYENWPKSRKCIMCGTIAPRTSPCHSNISIKSSTEGDSRPQIIEENSINGVRRSNSRRDDLAGTANNYEYERRRRNADWTWLNACMGVVQGDVGPVGAYLSAGGDPARQLTPSEVSLLNRPSAFDPGHTLVHLAIRFKREDILAMLVESIDGGGPGLKRVPSYIAPELATSIRRHAANTFNTKHSRSVPFPYVTEFTTFMLPAEIEDLPGAVQEQLFDELLDKDVQVQLETEPAVINWSIELSVHLGSRLHALWNRSQGDCLLDSLMQVTWGVFDRDNLLRRALSDSLSHGGHLLYPRWFEYETSQARQLEFTLSESQWEEDWASLVKRATQQGASLQQLHVFALAHILRRPVIVYGVKFVKSFRGEDLGYAGFEGVYLPLLWEPSFCNVSPVALGYTRGHFSALVPMESPQPEQSAKEESIQVCYLPLVDKDRKLLPIHFLTKAEVGSEENLLRQWLDVNVTEGGILVAQQRSQGRPLLVGQMLEEWLNHYRSLAQMSRTPYSSRTIPAQDFSSDGDTDDE